MLPAKLGTIQRIMLHKVLRFLLLLAVFNHGAVLPGTWQAAVPWSDASNHAVLHWQGVQHHHHEDGTVHKHGGSDSAQHLQIDDLMQSPAFTPPLDVSLAAVADPVAPASQRNVRPKAAFLAVPERPPRTRS
jgi:hypothetical protein